MSSNPPTPDQREPDQRERADRLEEIQQQLQDGARAAGRGLAPEALPEASREVAGEVTGEAIPEQEPEETIHPPWGVGASVAVYVMELIALGIPTSLAIRWLLEQMGTPVTGTWGPDDWAAAGLGWALTTLVYSPPRRLTRRFLKAQAAMLHHLAEQLTGRGPEHR